MLVTCLYKKRTTGAAVAFDQTLRRARLGSATHYASREARQKRLNTSNSLYGTSRSPAQQRYRASSIRELATSKCLPADVISSRPGKSRPARTRTHLVHLDEHRAIRRLEINRVPITQSDHLVGHALDHVESIESVRVARVGMDGELPRQYSSRTAPRRAAPHFISR